ncbi:MAG TPA: TIGR01777 family oxidoreductase [Gemmatimonadales bacterium]|nr:TIGR01777 family oxidoreductase [Gemmatimonadales bacterium]
MTSSTSEGLNLAVTGASGLIGSALVPTLEAAGHRVLRVTRGAAGPGKTRWDPEKQTIDSAAFEGIDGAIHLAGENIAERWTEAHKRSILESRRQGTELLAKTMAKLNPKPKFLIQASAVGIYGNRGSEPLTERSAPGEGFAPEVAKIWEASSDPAEASGIRVAKLRFGLVLTGAGGVLGKMLPPFKLGLGGKLGDGKQYMSWVALADLLAVVHRVIDTRELSGPINVTSPNPVTNEEFTHTLGKVLERPASFAVPAMVLHAMFGQMAEEVLLGGARVLPEKLQQIGFPFRYTELESALRAALQD